MASSQSIEGKVAAVARGSKGYRRGKRQSRNLPGLMNSSQTWNSGGSIFPSHQIILAVLEHCRPCSCVRAWVKVTAGHPAPSVTSFPSSSSLPRPARATEAAPDPHEPAPPSISKSDCDYVMINWSNKHQIRALFCDNVMIYSCLFDWLFDFFWWLYYD
jgi:hypothetical protein